MDDFKENQSSSENASAWSSTHELYQNFTQNSDVGAQQQVLTSLRNVIKNEKDVDVKCAIDIVKLALKRNSEIRLLSFEIIEILNDSNMYHKQVDAVLDNFIPNIVDAINDDSVHQQALHSFIALLKHTSNNNIVKHLKLATSHHSNKIKQRILTSSLFSKVVVSSSNNQKVFIPVIAGFFKDLSNMNSIKAFITSIYELNASMADSLMSQLVQAGIQKEFIQKLVENRSIHLENKPTKRISKKASADSISSKSSNNKKGIKSIQISSTRELNHEFDKLVVVLKTVNTNWQDRINALHRFQGIISSGIIQADVVAFTQSLKIMKDSFVVQLTELRSAVVREMCNTVSALCDQYNNNDDSLTYTNCFASFADVCVVALLKQIVKTIAIIKDSANNCIKDIIASTSIGYHRVLLRFISGFTSKSNILRCFCFEYITLCLQTWNVVTLNKCVDELEHALDIAITDSDSAVRSVARQCFWLFDYHFNSRATVLLNQFDQATQKRIHAAKGDLPLPQASFPQPSFHLADDTVASNQNQNNRFKKQAGRIPNASKPKKAYHSNDYSSSTSHIDTTNNKASAMSAPKRVILSKPMYYEQPVVSNSSSSKSLLGTAVRIQGNSNPNLVADEAVSVESIEEYVIPNETIAVKPSQETPQAINLDDIVRDCDTNNHWDQRYNALMLVNDLVKRSIETPIVSQNIRKIMGLLCERLEDDPHFKVIQATLDSLLKILPVYHAHVQNDLDRLLPSLLIRLTDNKKSIRVSSNELMNIIRECYEPDLIVSILCKIITLNGDKLKLGCYEFLTLLIPLTTSFFTSAHHVKFVLQRSILCYLNNKNKDLSHASGDVLKALYAYNSEAFIKQLLELPEKQLNIVKSKLCKKRIPTLENDIANYRNSLMKVKQAQEQTEELVNIVNETTQSEAVISITSPLVETRRNSWLQSPLQPVNGSEAKPDTAVSPVNYEKFPSIVVSPFVVSSQYDSLLYTPKVSPKKSVEQATESNLSSLINNITLGSIEERVSCLKSMIHLIETDSSLMHRDSGTSTQIVLNILDCLSDPVDEIVDIALNVFRKLISHQPDVIADMLETVMTRLMKCYSANKNSNINSKDKIKYSSDKTLRLLVLNINPSRTFVVLKDLLVIEKGATLAHCIKLLTMLYPRINSSELLDSLPILLPHLYCAVESTNGETRKAVIMSFVGLYRIFNDSFTKYMDALSITNRKLVTIYINKQDNSYQ